MARKMTFRKLLALALVITTCIAFTPSLAFAAEPAAGAGDNDIVAAAAAPMSAKADADNITVTIKGAGSGGTAQLYRYGANEYHTADTMKGLSTDSSAQGELMGTYTCGTNADIKFARYAGDGTDRVFSKYYLIQNGKILAGPVYAADMASKRNNGYFNTATKKGITLEDGGTIDIAKDLNVGSTVINMNLTELMVDNDVVAKRGTSGLIPFESNGKTYYFNENYIRMNDSLISAYSKEGMNVSLVVISWAKTCTGDYPSSLLYLPAKDQRQTMGFNTANDKGAGYWTAAMEFLADRYSRSADQGLVQQYIIGNEVDYVYDWYLMQPLQDSKGNYQKVEFNKFMEEYARTVRLANQAVKKYNSGAKVCVSITHNWAEDSQSSYGLASYGNKNIRYNSYAPKSMLDWMVKYEGARGDYNWGIASHPYPIGTTSSVPTKTDLNPKLMGSTAKPVTGNWKTTPWVTFANMEVYQLYLQQPVNMYNGTELRTVSITETSICSSAEGTAAAIEKSEAEQAGSIAQIYYRAANIDCINTIDYFQPTDQDRYKLGLMRQDGTKKPAYAVWKYVDTDKTYDYTNMFLKYLDPNATSYKQLMPLTKSEFNWNTEWSESNVQVRKVSTGTESVQRIYGAGRFETAFMAADQLKKNQGVSKFENIIVANGMNFADALAGSYLAKVKNAPIVLVNGAAPSNQTEVANYINANVNAGGTVYVLGGPVAIPDAFMAKVNVKNKVRLGGTDRFDTNLKILQAAGVSGNEVMVCTGMNFADSLSASACGRPILLVNHAQPLSAGQKQYLSSVKGSKFYIIGGTSAVNNKMADTIKAYGSVERIGGANRYATSTMIADKFFDNPQYAVLAYGLNFPDGLSGGPLAMSLDAPLVLTATGSETTAAYYTKGEGIYSGVVLGGPGLISDGAVNTIFGSGARR